MLAERGWMAAAFRVLNVAVTSFMQRAHGVVVSHPLRMRKALGSNPSVSTMRVTASEASVAPRGFAYRHMSIP